MNSNMCGAMAVPRPPVSLFTALDDLERAVLRLPSAADYSVQIANRYLGPPAEVADERPKGLDDSNVVSRLVTLTRCIDDMISMIEYNLTRLSE